MTGEGNTFVRRDIENVSGALSDLEVIGDSGFTDRVNTFHRWTGRVDKERLARAGFTYSGTGDKVVCPSCGLKLLNWTSTDDPLHEHAKRRQLCSFIISTYQQLRLNKPPKHPQYQELQARLDSFVGWPGRYVPKTPEELSAAGFFYIGSADRVTCFQCGITLRDWEEEHDPVVEHRRYSELCQFINNTDLNQLGVNTRDTTVHSGQNAGACANVTDDRNTNTDKETCQAAIGAIGGTSPKHKKEELASEKTVKHNSQVNSPGVNEQQPKDTDQQPRDNDQQPRDNDQQPRDNDQQPRDNDQNGNSCKDQENIKSTGQHTEMESDQSTPTGSLSASQKLANENRKLRERRTCKVCKKETVNTLFLPCGHLVTCSSCAHEVKECITCGKTILGTVKTYFV